MGVLDNIFYALDTPGALARGILAGKPGQRATGREALHLGPNEEGLDFGDVLGFLAEVVLDPINLIPGGTLAKSLRAASKVKKENALVTKALEAGAMPAELAAKTKILDEAGKPMVTLHGTPHVFPLKPDFTKLDPEALHGRGFYTTQDVALPGSSVEQGIKGRITGGEFDEASRSYKDFGYAHKGMSDVPVERVMKSRNGLVIADTGESLGSIAGKNDAAIGYVQDIINHHMKDLEEYLPQDIVDGIKYRMEGANQLSAEAMKHSNLGEHKSVFGRSIEDIVNNPELAMMDIASNGHNMGNYVGGVSSDIRSHLDFFPPEKQKAILDAINSIKGYSGDIISASTVKNPPPPLNIRMHHIYSEKPFYIEGKHPLSEFLDSVSPYQFNGVSDRGAKALQFAMDLENGATDVSRQLGLWPMRDQAGEVYKPIQEAVNRLASKLNVGLKNPDPNAPLGRGMGRWTKPHRIDEDMRGASPAEVMSKYKGNEADAIAERLISLAYRRSSKARDFAKTKGKAMAKEAEGRDILDKINFNTLEHEFKQSQSSRHFLDPRVGHFLDTVKNEYSPGRSPEPADVLRKLGFDSIVHTGGNNDDLLHNVVISLKPENVYGPWVAKPYQNVPKPSLAKLLLSASPQIPARMGSRQAVQEQQ